MPRVIKAYSVKFDLEHKVNIDVPPPAANSVSAKPSEEDAFVPMEGFEEDTEEISAEEQAAYIIEDAKKEAENIIQEAEKQAQKILADVRAQGEAESKALKEAAENEGRREGYEAGLAEAAQIKKEAAAVLESAVQEREQTLHSIEPEMVELIINICNKILSDSVQINSHVVVNLIKQGFSKSTITGKVYIHVSQEDYDNVLENKDTILLLQDSKTEVEIVRDALLTRGDCVIETPFGNVDCSLGQQFTGLKQDLRFLLENP